MQPGRRRLYAPTPLDSRPAPCEIGKAGIRAGLVLVERRTVKAHLIIRPFLPCRSSCRKVSICCRSWLSRFILWSDHAGGVEFCNRGDVAGIALAQRHERKFRRVLRLEIHAATYPR